MVSTLRSGELKVCFYTGFAPVCFKKNDTASGYDVLFLQDFAETLHLKFVPAERTKLEGIWTLPASNELPMDQRVQVTTCLMSDCQIVGLRQAILEKPRAAIGSLYEAAIAIGTETKGFIERFASARRSNRTL